MKTAIMLLAVAFKVTGDLGTMGVALTLIQDLMKRSSN